MTIVGRTYLERGEPVTVLAQWRGGVAWAEAVVANAPAYQLNLTWLGKTARSGPRNVLIQRANDDLVVLPFRGLRRAP